MTFKYYGLLRTRRVHILNHRFHVQSNDGFLAFLCFQATEGDLGVHETILGEDRRTVEVLQDVVRFPNVGISIGR